jgi:hypothetical protein
MDHEHSLADEIVRVQVCVNEFVITPVWNGL